MTRYILVKKNNNIFSINTYIYNIKKHMLKKKWCGHILCRHKIENVMFNQSIHIIEICKRSRVWMLANYNQKK